MDGVACLLSINDHKKDLTMSVFKAAVPVLFLLTAFSGTSDAALAYQRTYCVQVKYEMWRNGSAYWATEFETSDREDAELMFDLLLFALDNDSICSILDCGFDWIIVDVRLVTKYHVIQPTRSWYQKVPLYRNF